MVDLISVPAQSCLCESTITSQNALHDDQFQFPPVLISFENEDSVTSKVVDDCNDALADSNYVFCNDEVTFYSPGTEMEDDDTDPQDEENMKITNVQIHIDSSNAQNDKYADFSYKDSSDLNAKKILQFENTFQNSETSNLIAVTTQGNYFFLGFQPDIIPFNIL